MRYVRVQRSEFQSITVTRWQAKRLKSERVRRCRHPGTARLGSVIDR